VNNPVASMLVVSRKVENALVKTFRCVCCLQRSGVAALESPSPTCNSQHHRQELLPEALCAHRGAREPPLET